MDQEDALQGATGFQPVDTDLPDIFFDEFGETDITRRNLPHWKQDGKLYFVTWRLGDSLPRHALDQLEADRKAWNREHGNKPIKDMTPIQKRAGYDLFHQRVQKWLDAGSGSCVLRQEGPRRIMIDAFHDFHGERYTLGTYAVAANHVHVLFAPLPDIDLSRILHSWKSFTGTAINKCVEREGPLCIDENFDQLVRHAIHLERIEDYIMAHARIGAYVERRSIL